MKYINIGEKPRPVHYGINALSEFNEATKTDLAWIFGIMTKPLTLSMNHVRWLAYVGLKQGAIENNSVVDFDVDTVGKWLDKDFLTTWKEFMDALKDGMPGADSSKKK